MTLDHGTNVGHYLSAKFAVEVRRRNDFEDYGWTMCLVLQYTFEHLVSLREEQAVEDQVSSFRLLSLVDDLQDCKRRELVGA